MRGACCGGGAHPRPDAQAHDEALVLDTVSRERLDEFLSAIALHVLPSRTPTVGSCFEYGFTLRLPAGPALERDDPLLAAFGAAVECLQVTDDHEEALQDERLLPWRSCWVFAVGAILI